MSVRRVKGSYRNSLRRFGSGDPNKAVRNSAWIFRNGEWRLIFDSRQPNQPAQRVGCTVFQLRLTYDGEEACLLYAKHESQSVLILKPTSLMYQYWGQEALSTNWFTTFVSIHLAILSTFGCPPVSLGNLPTDLLSAKCPSFACK
ncbi:hypothetical protein DAPPUDRAFT_233202 [Daphnia pulex]|uniref:Uncharacterized protein n=1 Tax=Daphnia pulex TaxID=6669 RepID=E9FTH9_DAPPU|nr:hypothetical protein DAPPUDRAFT_233202 [Daphnia pulex]|eukprot:EFX89364.1 hypothetical protein DAPPUDRAFT_233202 [Daphnia pulex]